MRQTVMAIRTAGVLLVFLCCLFMPLLLWHLPAFEKGKGYELYFGTSSSPVLVTDTPLCDKLLLGMVAGESVRYDGDRRSEIEKTFGASLAFTEEMDGGVNYYYYAPQLKGGVHINGYLVNLHVCVRGEETAVGTPVIFGGF